MTPQIRPGCREIGGRDGKIGAHVKSSGSWRRDQKAVSLGITSLDRGPPCTSMQRCTSRCSTDCIEQMNTRRLIATSRSPNRTGIWYGDPHFGALLRRPGSAACSRRPYRPQRGAFVLIAIDGVYSVGKSTLIRQVLDRLAAGPQPVAHTEWNSSELVG